MTAWSEYYMKFNEFCCVSSLLSIIFLKKWASSERGKPSTNYSRKIKGKEINELSVWFLNQ